MTQKLPFRLKSCSLVFTFLSLILLGAVPRAAGQCPITQIPTYTYACSSGDFINSFTLNGIPATGNAGCNGQTNNYISYSSPVWNLTLGTTYTFTYTTGSWGQGFAIWIDLNNDGTYQTTECMATTASGTSGGGSFTIPITATPGTNRRMRTRCAYATTQATSASCTNQSFGETEDFFVNLVASSTCSGTPTAGTITTTGGTTFCGSGIPSFSLSGYTLASGITLQWQFSTNGGTTWTNYTGATASSYTPSAITTTTMVRCSVACTNSGLSAIAGPVTITINPLPTITPNAAQFFSCTSGQSQSISLSGTGTSYNWSPGTGLNTTVGASVIATPTTTTVYTVTATLGGCTSTLGIPVNVVPLASLTTTATPSAVCYGANTQLATTQANTTNYELFSIAPGLQPTPGATVIGSPTVTMTSGSNDDGYSTVTMPFPFTFYGNTYTTVYVAVNGYVGFNNGVGSLTSQTLPNGGAPNDVIALFWRDLHTGYAGSPSRITTLTTGTTPNRQFIITYDQVTTYGSTTGPWNTSNTHTGQIILYETSNHIDVITVNTPSTQKTSGVENSNGTIGLSPSGRNNVTYTVTAPGEAFRYVMPVYNYAWTPSTNLNNATVYNPVSSNNIAATTFNVTVTNAYTTCTATGNAAITINPLPVGTLAANPDTICDAEATTVTITGTSGSLGYFSQAGIPQAPLQMTGGVGTFNTNPLNVTTVYKLDSVISQQGCKLVGNSSDTVVVNPRPTAAISGTQTICNGTAAFLMVNVGQGVAPWTITYSDGSNTYTETSSNTSFAISVTPATTTTYTLTGMVDALCTSLSIDLTGSATVTVNPRPTATLSVPATTICDGTVQNLNVALTGTPPYNFDIYDGVSYTSYTNIMTNSFNIPLNISASTTYSISSLTDANCVGWLQDYGQPVAVTVNPRPSSVITGTDVICFGNSTSAMSVTLTGVAPWNFNYFDGNSTVAVTNVMSSPHTLTISPSVTATYTVVSVTDANGCSAYSSDMTGSGNVTVNYAPNILSQTNGFNACAGANAVFSVNVTGTGLVYQWTVNGNPLGNGGVYSGATSPTLTISDITGLNGNSYVLNVSGVCPPIVNSAPIVVNEATQNQWTGISDVNWSNTSNWSCGILPTAATDVTITPSAPHQPIVDIPSAVCKGLLIYPGSSIEITANNALDVRADIVNLGSFDADAGKLIIGGSVPQNVPGVIYNSIEVQGGSAKTFSGNAVVTNNLALYSGYIHLPQHNLVLAQNATVVGASPSSFVVTDGAGVVVGEEMGAGANTGTVLFPVGSDEFAYTPVWISNSGMADDINVKVINNVYENYNGDTPLGAPIAAGSVSKTWLIHETIPGGSNATITPQWNFAQNLSGFDPNNCAVSHYVGGEWEPGPLGVATGFSPYTRDLTGVTSFSPFGVSSSGPLGLNLLSFKGELVNDDSRLSWITTTEQNMKVYEVERSIDKGVRYEQIGEVKATGNGKAGNNNYNYVDASAAKLGTDRILYRLHMVDNTGKNSYSNVVAVTIGKEVVTGNINIYPNPVTGNDLYIRMGEGKGEAMSVMVTDMSGRVISTTEYKANTYNVDAVKVDVSQLATGVYLLRIVDANNTAIETLKFNRQ
jgi:hypothetical protein